MSNWLENMWGKVCSALAPPVTGARTVAVKSPLEERVALCGAFSSYFGSAWVGTKGFIESRSGRRLEEFLSREDFAELLGEPKGSVNMKMTWGPCAGIAPLSIIADNYMYASEWTDASGKKHILVSVAGTHPLSLFSWVFHDFDVFMPVEWPYAQRTSAFLEIMRNAGISEPEGHKLSISNGTMRGLRTLIEMKDDKTGCNLVDYLKGAVSDASGKIDVCITGHSLGGALCGALALYLHDNMALWDLEGKAVISCISFAGPTIGNKAFAAYYDAVLGSRTTRVANALDLVPNAWEVDLMKNIEDIYEPQLHAQIGFKAVVEKAINYVSQLEYTHFCSDQPFFQSIVTGTSFVAEVMAQHSKAYFDHYGLYDLANAIGEDAPLFQEAFCAGNFSLPSKINSVFKIAGKSVADVSWLSKLGDVNKLFHVQPPEEVEESMDSEESKKLLPSEGGEEGSLTDSQKKDDIWSSTISALSDSGIIVIDDDAGVVLAEEQQEQKQPEDKQ